MFASAASSAEMESADSLVVIINETVKSAVHRRFLKVGTGELRRSPVKGQRHGWLPTFRGTLCVLACWRPGIHLQWAALHH